MKILSVSPQQILFPFSGMRQHSFFTSEAGAYTSAWYSITCFPLECWIADNADPIFCALISLPVSLPLLVASTDNKLDLCLGLEDCTGICALHHQTTHTSLVNKGCGVITIHIVFPYLRLGVCAFLKTNSWGNICPMFGSINPNLAQQEFCLNYSPAQTYRFTTGAIMDALNDPHINTAIEVKLWITQWVIFIKPSVSWVVLEKGSWALKSDVAEDFFFTFNIHVVTHSLTQRPFSSWLPPVFIGCSRPDNGASCQGFMTNPLIDLSFTYSSHLNMDLISL